MGCRVCRARKVKCDGRPNGCRNCERLQLDCVGDTGDNASPTTPGKKQPAPMSLRKIRTYRSCTSCRMSKTKCNGDRPKCSRCTTKGSECVYDGGAAPRWARNLDGSEVPRNASADESSELLLPATSSASYVAGSSVASEQGDGIGSLGQPPDGAAASLSRGSDASGSLDQSQRMSLDMPLSEAHSWLLSSDLPGKHHLRRVVEQYFANVHPLRCFAFIHKPSFMRQLDKGFTSDDESALLHVICAHGAKFHVLNLNQQSDPAPGLAFLRAAGNQWAKKAEYLTMANFGKISAQRLMTAILLHDFHFRLGEFSQALMLSGLAVRMAHALKINTEYSVDILCTEANSAMPSVVSRESRRRLMWACYVLDAWAGSGVDQLTLLRENDIKIQLPCNERNFGLRIASVTETLGVGHVLQFLPPAIVPRRPAGNMGIMAYYIRVVTLWKRIVRYVNHMDARPPPWLPESDFAALDGDLRLWRRELPDFVEYSTETIYARLDSNQLGALVLIHCTYHHNYLELYKLSMPDLFKLPRPLTFPPEHQEFLQSAQANSYYHAQQIAMILTEAAEHGTRLLSDSLLPFFVYDSSRVILYYVARLLDPARVDAKAKVRDAIKSVESNNRILRLMSSLFPIAQSLSTTIERWLFKIKQSFNRGDIVNSLQSEGPTDFPGVDASTMPSGSPTHDASEYVLPPLSLHALARTGTVTGASDRRLSDRTPGSRGQGPSQSWIGDDLSTNGGINWDRTTVAHQLVGMSTGKDTSPVRPSLQHERPVSLQERHRGAPSLNPMCEALDLNDLQNFSSWDMYGIMEMGDTMSNDDTDDTGIHWGGEL